MSREMRFAGFGIMGALTAVAILLVVAMPGTEAQMSDLVGDEGMQGAGFDAPGFLNFCAGNPCPGQTCDEVNDKCVGSLTLQPALGEPLVGLSQAQLDLFDKGRIAFDKTFNPELGLGPVFNQDSCASCHSNPVGGSGTITVLRFGMLDFDTLEFDGLADLGGSLWNQQSIPGDCAEVIPVPPTNWASNRLTNSMLGFGLVEAIPGAAIEVNAITPPPGISGRANIRPILESPGLTGVGRFGWKDQLVTVESFTADAMHQEMGITSRIFPEDNAPNNDPVKLAACDTVADPEDVPDVDGDEFLDLTTAFQRFLAAPPQTPRSGMTGEALFNTIGCADCHMTGFVAESDDEGDDMIDGQVVNAYSDFLLHDVGGNADFIEQDGAGVTEIRTTLLWGLRIRDPLWHDGRVAGGLFDFRMQNAIQLHDSDGSEGQASAQAYFALDTQDQFRVIQFLDSLGRREFDMDGDGDVDMGDVLVIEDCSMTDLIITPDDPCAFADVDQNGSVNQLDLDLLDVVLGVIDPGDDEGDDESDDNSDDMSSDDDFVKADFDPVGSDGDRDGVIDLDEDPNETPFGTDNEKIDRDDDQDRTRSLRRVVSRRGQ